jgi:hypothetical protein
VFALSDSQLRIVLTAAAAVLPDRRSLFLERTSAMLVLRGRFDDRDVAAVVKLATCGLVVQSSNAA